jgi:hypothetical protein
MEFLNSNHRTEAMLGLKILDFGRYLIYSCDQECLLEVGDAEF